MTPPTPRSTASSDPAPSAPPPRVRSEDLLRGRREIVIDHQGQEYRLLRTRNNRLILNK